MNSPILIQKCHGLTFGELKFSGVINSNVAAVSIPTMAGRRPENIDCTSMVFIYFMNILLAIIMIIKDGKINAIVAILLPSIDMPSLYPALCMAVYPQYVAELIPIGPGVA